MSDDLLGHLHEDIIQPHQIASGTLFVSYSRKNRDFAKALYAKLARMGFKLWRDVHDIDAGADDWWLAIQEAIRESETVILCMSMHALKSPVVADEWFYARELGKRIIPVVVDDIWEHKEVKNQTFTIPNWMTRTNWIDFRANTPEADSAWANFIRTLNETYVPKRFINMVEELPPRFVRRPQALDNIIRSLVDDKNDAVAMTTALRGAGGYGKTTLAKAVARDIRVQGAFDDGILWVTLGEELLQRKGDNLKNALIGRALDLIYALTNERPVIETLELARTKLEQAIGDLYILLVIDDVWDENHLKPFLVKTKHSACLITTRNSDTLRGNQIAEQVIDKMKPIEAVELLGAGIDPDEVKPHEAKLLDLARELREYPLLLALANTQITNYMTDMRLPLADAIELARQTLNQQGVLGFDDMNTDDRTRAVSATLGVSIRQLNPDQQRLYRELAIFAEDALIPLTTLSRYWGLSEVNTLQFCTLLYRKTALLHSFECKAVRIHDVFRDYLIRQWTTDELRALHQRLITHYDDLRALPDAYAWRNIAYHLKGADDIPQLRRLLLDFVFLREKLHATDPNTLLNDYDAYLSHDQDQIVRLVRSALSNSRHRLLVDKHALAHQLAGRLMHHRKAHPDIDTFIQHIEPPPHSLYPIDNGYDPLNPAGGHLQATLSGHKNGVTGASELRDGRILSWSDDGTLRLWSADGTPLATLRGHESWGTGASELRDGRILSWSWDNTLRLWSADGTPFATLRGHERKVWGASELRDGRILSWSWDNTLRLWSADGTPFATLRGHEDSVRGASELRDGRILSWSEDDTLRLWSADGTPFATLRGHESWVTGASELRDGRILSWSLDNTLRLWSADGTPFDILSGHEDSVRGASELRDGRILSWSEDNTLRLWSADGTPFATLRGHEREVTGASELKDGRILSWSWDNTLRLWSADGTPFATLRGHESWVTGASELKDGRILSWSWDNTLRLWSADGTPFATLRGHEREVTGASELRDGRILSWSRDDTLRLWSADGTPFATLRGHERKVLGASELRDGRILSWSEDNTLRLWSADGTPFATLRGHERWVTGASELKDGRILSWSEDNTLRLWSADGTPFATLRGHGSEVLGASELKDGRILSWSIDETLRLWSADGTPFATLLGHEREVTGASELRDGRILSWSWDNTLRLWSADGTPFATLRGHESWVTGASELRDGRILSWSEDNTLRLWLAYGTPFATLRGHERKVLGASELRDGRILSWSEDNTLRLWSADGTPFATLRGHERHERWVTGASELRDGRILSWSEDNTLRLWSADGTPIDFLRKSYYIGDRHNIATWARAHGLTLADIYPPEQRTAPFMVGGCVSRKDREIIIYHPQTGERVTTFYGDAPFTTEPVVLAGGRVIAVGDQIGRVLFLRWVGEDEK